MKLQEIFDQLTYGELSQIVLGGADEGKIDESNYPKLLAHINLGLTALYKRFNLKESSVIVELQSGVTMYRIHSDYAKGNRRARGTQYILDSFSEPFLDDIIKIRQIWTEKGVELDLNNSYAPFSILTPQVNVITVPLKMVDGSLDQDNPYYTKTIQLVYQADHPNITVGQGNFNPERVEVELPYTLLEPLLFFVASRIFNPIGLTNEFHTGNNYAAKYEAACQQIEMQGLKVDTAGQDNRLARKGFV